MVDPADPTRRTPRTYSTAEEPPKKELVTTSGNGATHVWDESRVATSPSADVAELRKTFTDSKSLALEIVRLKEAGATPMTIIMRQAEWVQLAKKEGLPEPTKALDPKTATPAEIARAAVWSSVGGVVPRAELEKDGGKAYLASIRDAIALHTHVPTQDEILAATGKKLLADAKEDAQRKYIGLDGRIGTEEQLVFYERTEAIAAMYADTTTGSLAATAPNVVHRGGPPDVQEMRGLGAMGDQAETFYGNHSPALKAPRHGPHVECERY